MKKLFALVAALFCFTLGAFAQGPSLKITNHTSCDVHMQFYGAKAPLCNIVAISPTIITVPAGGTVFYTNPTAVPIPGLGTSDFIVGVLLHEWPPACGSGNMYKIGEACAGLPPSVSYNTINNTCRSECFIKAVWTPGPGAALDFFP